jgi:hypothetical protein
LRSRTFLRRHVSQKLIPAAIPLLGHFIPLIGREIPLFGSVAEFRAGLKGNQ